LSLCLIKHYTIKAYRGVDVEIHISCPRHLLEVSGQLHAPASLARERTTGTHWTEGRADPRADLDDVEKRKFLALQRRFIQKPYAKRAKELLKLNRHQLRWVAGLLTGHCHLNGHLFKLGLSNSPTCDRCQEENETATHVLCECEALADFRFRHLGQYFMEPSDYFDVPTYKILHYIRSAGLLRG
jgi:hypothetical protein